MSKIVKELLNNQSFRIWLLIMGTAPILIGTDYTMVQQSTRHSANDAPIILSQTIKHRLDAGAAPKDVIPKINSDLSADSIPFAIITDGSRNVLASSASLAGKTVLPPQGVFLFTQAKSLNELTWQPASNARLAIYVTTYTKDGNTWFIITGQSLKLYEDRVTIYTELALLAWLAVLIWTSLVLFMPLLKI